MKSRIDSTLRGSQKQSTVSGAEISRFIEELNSLKDGEGAVAKLIACGSSAIEPLRQFLLTGEPSVVYHTRRWAVDALASLGARDVLLEYLKQERDIPDPAVQFGEEAVKSAAAQKLIKWPSEEVIQVLIEIARERCLPGALEALGELKRPEAIPLLVKALEDDLSRPTAENALRKIGPPAELALIQVAVTPYPNRESEKPSSLLRRRSAVGLLAEIGIRKTRCKLLLPLLDEVDGEILSAAFRIVGGLAGAEDRTKACHRLIELLRKANWYTKGEIENALIDRFEMVSNIIDEEIFSRRQRSQEEWCLDPVLPTLLNVKRRAEQGEIGIA